MIDRIQLLRNIGQFDSVDTGAQLPLLKFALVYAENGRGKTTLAAIFRSLRTGDPSMIAERHRLSAQHPSHVVLTANGQQHNFQNNVWSAIEPQVVVFDDLFVAQNVCSGIEIESGHRQNLHELILGAQGVALNVALQRHVSQIEEHNRALRDLADAIPNNARGNLSVDAFCALAARDDIDHALQEAERNLAAANSADAVREAATFETLELPAIHVDAIDALLHRSFSDLEASSAAHVQAHLAKLGKDAAAWVSDGLQKIAGVSANEDHEVCPFCAQDLRPSPIIEHYQAYFSEAYTALKNEITEVGKGVAADHGGETQAAFERGVRVAAQGREFWRTFIDVPEIESDTAAIARAWKSAREQVLVALRAKLAAPLEPMALSPEALTAIARYDDSRTAIAANSAALQECNLAIAVVKEQAAAANVLALTADLDKLKAVKARHSDRIAPRCQSYLVEKAAKKTTEDLRDAARRTLDDYRGRVFPAYETAINGYLQKFNAGFRLGSVTSVNNRTGSSCTYNVLINDVPVALTAEDGPSFKNTLSAGDRNALALAFFFASLDQDPELARKTVVIDDPMTSLDEHRSLTTVQEMRRLLAKVSQVIVLSHSKPFLCSLWEGADTGIRSAMRIIREGAGSTLATWDVRQDCITEHDRRHELVTGYLALADAANERAVASALRPILEAFMRVAYPRPFPPGSLLGPFIGICQQRVGTPNQILRRADIDELRDLLDYANKFHHDTNAAWETEAINDQELSHFSGRTVAFAQRT